MTDEIHTLGIKMGMLRTLYKAITLGEEEVYPLDAYENIDLIIIG